MRHMIIALSLTLLSSVAHAGVRFEALAPLPASVQGLEIEGIQLAQAAGQSAAKIYTYRDGLMRGEMAAKSSHSTGSSLAGGLVWGFGLGIVGTGIGYFTTGTSDPPAREMVSIQDKGDDYIQGFIAGYRDKARSKNKSAKLGGGLLGTLFIVALVLG